MSFASRILMAGLMVLLAGCAGLPASVDRRPSSAYADTGDTSLGRALAPAVAAHPGKTGVLPLISGREAFAARMIAARVADRSIDVQYYIWHADTTGSLLFEALWQAAERGVRVRLLLDDQNTRGLDTDTGGARRASQHRGPAVQSVRQPAFAHRRLRDRASRASIAACTTSRSRSTTRSSIVGGRNIGDEYLERGHAGRIRGSRHDRRGRGGARRLARSSTLTGTARPPILLAASLPAADADAVAGVRARLGGADRERRGRRRYLDAVRETPLVQQLIAGDAGAGMGAGAPGDRRPRQGAASARAARAADGPASRGGIGQAAERAGPRLALFRADAGRHRRAARDRRARRARCACSRTRSRRPTSLRCTRAT